MVSYAVEGHSYAPFGVVQGLAEVAAKLQQKPEHGNLMEKPLALKPTSLKRGCASHGGIKRPTPPPPPQKKILTILGPLLKPGVS